MSEYSWRSSSVGIHTPDEVLGRHSIFNHGETDMGDKGSKDKDKREQQKKAQLSAKEKKKLKKEKKDK